VHPRHEFGCFLGEAYDEDPNRRGGLAIELSPAGRAGTPDEVATVGALLMGLDGAFITGSDVLIDGGVTASYFYGELAPE
jgi:NAD(P)-dependent dehydrogenase (short-subunit alcohol dehydrogenase family)